MPFFLIPTLKKQFREQNYICSSIFDVYFQKKSKKKKNFLVPRSGIIMFYRQFNKLIWQFDLFFCPTENNLYFVCIQKNRNIVNIKNTPDFVEIWRYCRMLTFKKKCCLFLSEEVWDLKWSKLNQKQQKIIVLCFGFDLKIFEMPKIYPQYTKLISASMYIKLIGVFQWKLSWSGPNLAVGDINGKIVLYEFEKTLSLCQIGSAVHTNSPISCLNIFSGEKSNTKYLISGGFDGYVKLWNLSDRSKPIFQINYYNRRIMSVSSNIDNFGFPVIFTGLDSGYFSIVSLSVNFDTNIQFGHQGGFSESVLENEQIYSVGCDGDFVISDLIFPSYAKHFFLDSKFFHKILSRQTIRPNAKNFILQTCGTRFANKLIRINQIPNKRSLALLTGNAGVLLFLNFKKI